MCYCTTIARTLDTCTIVIEHLIPGQPSVITEEIAEYLDKMLKDDDELSAS